jgi:hypothetical protein
MKTNVLHTALILLLFGFNFLSAQPFTLDKNIKPIKLELTEHPKYEGAKYVESGLTLKKGSINYHYVRGHDIYQYVDIFIFPDDEQTNLKADVVYNTWTNIEETQTIKTSKKGYINFKVRSYQDIGFTVSSEAYQDVPYTIKVNASPELKTYLDSPFVKATKQQMVVNTETAPAKTSENVQSNTWIYGIIGVLLLVVGLLAGKLMGRKKTHLLILFMMLSGMLSQAQTSEDVNSTIGNINNAFGTEEVLEDFIRQYRNLGSCLRSGTPPGQPRIPSFCNGEESECANCFAAARAEFNRCRYNLEKLQTIYDCSRAYIDASIALGDNVSGVHGALGLIWQSQKRGIMRSVRELERTYDSKRAEMLHSFHESLEELDACESAHGLEDWYDRFGVMFYNFVEMRYHR